VKENKSVHRNQVLGKNWFLKKGRKKMDSKESILIVDDEESIRRSLTLIFRKNNYEIDTAETGKEALKKVQGRFFNMALLDIKLPDMEGTELLKPLKEMHPDIVLLMLTGHASLETALKALNEGASAYINKTSNMDEVLATVREALEKQRLVMENRKLLEAVQRELSERKQAEEALQKSRDEFWELYDNAPVGYHQIDVEGRIILVNQTEATLLGYTKEEMLGSPVFDFIAKKDRDIARESVRKKIAQEQPVSSFERTYVKKDGSEIPVAIEDRFVFDKQGKVVGIRSTLQDISMRKRAEEELQNANRRLEETLAELKTTQRQLIQQERLRALGQMASGITHDFNNSLTPILGYSELLFMAPAILDDKEKVINYLELMHTAAKGASSVVNRLRNFYRERAEDEVFSSVDLNQLVKQTIRLTESKWKDQAQSNGITISVRTDLQEVPFINGNSSELQNALTNLIFNAVDATPESGTITIRTRLDNDSVVLEVSDTGIGMTDEVQQRCFDPFFSTKDESGTGLGLSIVHGIIRRHEGTIEINSEPGEGTTFIIRLPIQVEEHAIAEEQEKATVIRSLHVLLVDDKPDVRDVISQYLLADGHTVETANNGREGLDKFYDDTHSKESRFDLVITDRAMPDMNGIQLAGFIKQIAPDKPIIMLTGFGDVMRITGDIPAEIDYLLSKPVTLNHFREALAKVTEKLTI